METPPKFFEQLLEIYITPEILRRQAAGIAPTPFPLRAAQLICFADSRPNLVRLNDEVQAVASVKLRDGVAKEKGDLILVDEIEGYEAVVLPETEDPDCGHATMLSLAGRWFVVFDFRYNRGKSSVFLARAREFFVLAEDARMRDAWSSMVYVLFSAAELAARAELLLVPNPEFERSKKHEATRTRFNKWTRMGNASLTHSGALNKLSKLRQPAVYAAHSFTIDAETADELLDAVRELIDWTSARLGQGDRPYGSAPSR